MMRNYDLILISTCCNHNYIFKLIDSVLHKNSILSVCLVIVNQTKEVIEKIPTSEYSDIIIIEHGKNVNSSIARNIGIQYIIENNFVSNFVCFPDDDSSYDHLFFLMIQDKIRRNDDRNLIIDVYCTGTTQLFRKVNLKNNFLLSKKNFDIVGAVNMVLNFSTFRNVKFFDVRFGINAKYGAGEDGDYFIRAVQMSSFFYCNEIYNFHPSSLGKFKILTYKQKRRKLNSYGIGVIALLCKHKMYSDAFFVTFRAFGGVIFSIVKFDFYLGMAYFEAFFVRFYHLIIFSFFGLND